MKRLCLIAAVIVAGASHARADFAACILISGSGSGSSSASYASYTSGAFCGIPPGFQYSPDSSSQLAPNSLARGLTAPSLTLTDSTGSAFGAASLTTGTVSASGTSANTSATPNFSVQMTDNLHWIVSGGPATITVNVHVSGSKNLNGSGSDNDGFTLAFGPGRFNYNMYTSPPTVGEQSVSGWLTSQFSNKSATGFDFTGTISVANGDAATVTLSLAGSPRGGASTALTGSISMALPTSVSYTSDSGAFLSQRSVLAPLPCGQESALLSLNSNTPTTVQFVNTTTQPVRIYWRDFSGVRVLYRALSPGDGYVQQTFLTHPWIVTDVSDRCVAIYEPIASAGVARISINGIVLTQTGFTFQAVQGGPAPIAAAFNILYGSSGALDLRLTPSTVSGGGWLSVSPTSGVTDSTKAPPVFAVSANPAGLAPGDYYGQIRIDSQAALNTPQFLSIVLNVLAPNAPLIPSVQPTGLTFVMPASGFTSESQSVRIAALANHSSPFTVVTVARGGGWGIISSPGLGTLVPGQPIDLQVSAAKLTGLAPGAYQGSLTVNFPQDKVVETVNVVLIVTAPPTSAAPGGNTPLAASTCNPTKLLPTFTILGSNFVAPAAWPAPVEVHVSDDCGAPLGTGSVSVTFSNGDPLLVLVSHQDGFWSGTWAPSNARTAATKVTATAFQPETNLSATVTLDGNVPANMDVPELTRGGVVSAASYSANAIPSPGELVSIFGNNMASGVDQSTKLPLDTQLSGTSLSMAGRLLPLVFTSAGQINAEIPFEVPAGATHQLILKRGTRLSVPQPVSVVPAEPAIFTTDLSGAGQGHIYVFPTATQQLLADAANPAKAGDIIVIYCSGLGLVAPPVTSGAATPSDQVRKTVNPVTLTIGGVNADVAFAGLTAGFSSLYQVNAVVPAGITASATTTVLLNVAGISSAPVTMATR